MNFVNRGDKATEAVARLIKQSGGPIDYLRLTKLIYLADRQSIIARGVPIVGGHYYSMRKGPVISEVMDFVHDQSAPSWRETISPRYGNEVRLNGEPAFRTLSQSELDILDKVVVQHSQRTTEELVDWCHKRCSEYESVQGRGRKPITVEAILKAEMKSDQTIQNVVNSGKELEEMDKLLT